MTSSGLMPATFWLLAQCLNHEEIQAHLQLCSEAIERIGGDDTSILTAVLIKVVHEKVTLASHAVHMKVHSERGPLHMQTVEW
jgi:hypothetical protein